MKIVKIHEMFKRDSYEFNIIEFYENFRNIFYKLWEEDNEIFMTEIRKIKDWDKLILNMLTNEIVYNILKDKEIEFYDINNNIEFGRVKKTSIISKYLESFKLIIDIYGQNLGYIQVNHFKPIKVYSKKTKIEDIIDLHVSLEKYNL
jgi:hypothetical protein